jgi:serine/threonine protein kinase/tetratricopeptide (TPR) repeat protein
MSRLRSWLAELRRRRVIRAAGGYLVVGWIMIQVTDAILPGLPLPAETTAVVLFLIIIGLPIALVLAWAYDITPEGIQKTDGDRWQQVQALFDEAIAMPPAARATFVARVTGNDATLRRELDTLLKAHNRSGPLDRPLADWVEPAEGEITTGRSIGHYRVLSKLGDGGMGVVYSARDERLDRVVALKFLPPHLSLRDEAKQRFLIEAQAAAALDHANICTVHEIGQTPQGQLFIAMPLYDGETVKQRLARGVPSTEEAINIVIQAARGLAKAHDRGIVHRDIKPANLIVTSDGVLKIVDFGIAKLADVTMTRPGDAHGTLAYMSPEQTRGEHVDGRSDIWSLGIVLYELLTGRRPFGGATDQLVAQSINTAPLPHVQPETDAEALPIGGILQRMLAKERSERYTHATDLIRELERYLSERARRARERTAPTVTETTPVVTETTLPDQGERRPATVVIANLSGYSGLIERLRPDQLQDLSAQIRATAEEIATRNGGMLNEFREDELVLLFGIPIASEDHSVRAARAALELHDRIRVMRSEQNADLRLHTGIDTGPLIARPAHATGVHYQTVGDALRIARRLAANAAPDEVWISPECHRAIGPFFDTESRPRISLRDRTFTPRRLLRHTGVRSRLDASLRTGLTRYVGRERELERLEEAFTAALTGAGQLVAVTGDAGLGKSRLLHEFRVSTLKGRSQLLMGRCQAHGNNTAYLPFSEVLRTCFGIDESDHSRAAAMRVAQRATEIGAELTEFAPLYLHLLGLESSEHPVPRHLHGDQLRIAIQEAIVALLTVTARTNPLLLLLEDWHWVDDASQAVLEQLMEVAADQPLLAIVTSRAALSSPTSTRFHVLTLDPLGAPASRAMLSSMSGGYEFPEDIAEVLHARAGGNPFFLEEICHALLEDGTLRVDDGNVRLTGPIDSLLLPDTVQAIIHTRLERLERETRDVVRLASVVGREFTRSVLERALPNTGRLPNALQALKSAGLIQQVRIVPEAVFRFKHVLTQEVAYRSMLAHQRKDLHARVAAAIEAGDNARVQDQLQQLAHHHSRAEHWVQAVDYGVRAADRLHALSEFTEALQQLERCEEWLERSEVDERPSRYVDILLRQERLCETLGLRARQQDLIDRLIVLLESTGDRARLAEVYLRQGDLFTLLRDFDRAENALDKSLRMRRELADPAGERHTLRSLGLMLWHQGRNEESLRTIDRTLALDRHHRDITGIVADLVGRGAVLKSKGDLEHAQIALEEALDLSQRELAGDEDLPGGLKLPYILHGLANVYRERGESERALTLLREALVTSENKHLPVQASYHRTAIAHILLQQGKVDESVETYRAAVTAARRARYSPGLCQALSALGEVLFEVGTAADALPHLAEASDLFTQLGDTHGAARMWSLRALAHYQLRDYEAARTGWTRARELYRDCGDPVAERKALRDEARVRNSLAIAAFNRGDYDGALDEYRAALALFRTLGDAGGIGLMLNSIGVTLVRHHRYDEAEEALNEALALHRSNGNILMQAYAETSLGEIYEARGETERARAHYAESIALRDQSGDRPGMGWSLYRLARVAARSGATHEANELGRRAHLIADECGDVELLAACAVMANE